MEGRPEKNEKVDALNAIAEERLMLLLDERGYGILADRHDELRYEFRIARVDPDDGTYIQSELPAGRKCRT